MTKDGGKTCKNYFDKIPTTQFYTITYDMEKPFNVFGSIQDEGTFSANIENSFGKPRDTTVRNWDYAPGGEGTQIQVDPVNANLVYSSSFYGRLMKSDLSKPDSTRSTRIAQFAVGRIDSLRGEWLAATKLSRFDHRVIYHGLQHLYKSADAGETWTRISDDLSYNDPTKKGIYPYLIYHQAITAIEEGSTPGDLYVGTDDGRVWHTLNDGNSWKEISKGLPYNKHVAKITHSVFSRDRVYVVLNDRRADNHAPYLFVSENGGKTWKSISANIPASPANVLIEHPDNEQVLLAGTDMGIYISVNRGITWSAFNGNLPTAIAVEDMFIHPRDKNLVIATYGRGVWVTEIPSLKK
jgi:hypothetical protein